MQRIAGDDVDADLFGAGKDGFTDGNPGTEAATVLTPEWCNQLQEELVAGLIEHAGLTPDATTVQVRAAIAAIAWTFSGFVKCSNASGVAATAGNLLTNGGFMYCDASGAPDTRSRTRMLSLFACRLDGSTWASGVDDATDKSYLANITPGTTQTATWDLVLPAGCILTQVRAGTEQGATAAADMKLEVFTVGHHKAAPISAKTVTLQGTATATDAGEDVLTVSGLSSTGSSNTSVIIRITCSNGASVDYIHWVDYSFDDPGPRNY